MNKNQNLFLAVAIWLACMLALYTFFPGLVGAKHQPQKTPATAGAQAEQGAPGQVSPPSASVPAAGAAAAGAPAPTTGSPGPTAAAAGAGTAKADVPRGTAAAAPPPLRLVTFETSRARVVATSEGAAIQSVQLLGDKWTRHKGGKEESHVDLVAPHAGEPLPFSTVVKDAAAQPL